MGLSRENLVLLEAKNNKTWSLLIILFKIWDLYTKGGEQSYKETSAQARVSLYDFSPPEVYKSHILNRMIK